jgi:crotonobetainyl-CoA:carnitine CoA-transferase CaiB-like acyl-CoA transferase
VPSESGIPGVERTLATPIQLSTEKQKVPQRAPNVGEHSHEVLAEFGFDADSIADLEAAGVIATERRQ